MGRLVDGEGSHLNNGHVCVGGAAYKIIVCGVSGIHDYKVE